MGGLHVERNKIVGFSYLEIEDNDRETCTFMQRQDDVGARGIEPRMQTHHEEGQSVDGIGEAPAPRFSGVIVVAD